MSEKNMELPSQFFDRAIITVLTEVRADTRFLDEIARKISEINYVEDVFIVTGDYDILIKARFPSYEDFKNFLMNELTKIDGVNETRTMLVVNIYKERGLIFEG